MDIDDSIKEKVKQQVSAFKTDLFEMTEYKTKAESIINDKY